MYISICIALYCIQMQKGKTEYENKLNISRVEVVIQGTKGTYSKYSLSGEHQHFCPPFSHVSIINFFMHPFCLFGKRVPSLWWLCGVSVIS